MPSSLLSRVSYAIIFLTLVSISFACSGRATSELPTEAENADEIYARGMAACLKKKGWDVKVGQDPTGYYVDYTSPQGQDLALNRDANLCTKEIGFDNPPPPMSREELEALYKKQLATKECLEAEGYTIEEPPSEEAFVKNRGGWIAYGSLDPNKDKSGNPDEWVRINEKCPQP